MEEWDSNPFFKPTDSFLFYGCRGGWFRCYLLPWHHFLVVIQCQASQSKNQETQISSTDKILIPL